MNTLEKLPRICAARNPADGSPIMLCRGVSGYHLAPRTLDVDGFNSRHGVTKRQQEAMEIGSVFGWDVPGADPDWTP